MITSNKLRKFYLENGNTSVTQNAFNKSFHKWVKRKRNPNDNKVKSKTRVENREKLLKSINFRFIEDVDDHSFEELIKKVYGVNDGSNDRKIESLMHLARVLISGTNSAHDEKTNQSIVDFLCSIMIHYKGLSTVFLESPGLSCLIKEMRHSLEGQTRNSSITMCEEVMTIMKCFDTAGATSISSSSSTHKPKIFCVYFPNFSVTVDRIK